MNQRQRSIPKASHVKILIINFSKVSFPIYPRHISKLRSHNIVTVANNTILYI